MKKAILKATTMMLAVTCLGSITACSPNNGEQVIIRVLENDFAKKNGYLDVLLNAFNEKYKVICYFLSVVNTIDKFFKIH